MSGNTAKEEWPAFQRALRGLKVGITEEEGGVSKKDKKKSYNKVGRYECLSVTYFDAREQHWLHRKPASAASFV